MSDPLPVEELFRTPTRRKLIETFVTADPETVFRKEELHEQGIASYAKINENVGTTENPGPLVMMGVIGFTNPDGPMSRLCVPDTPVMNLLREVDRAEIGNLFETPATQKLTRYFLLHASAEQSYTYTQIQDATGVSQSAIRNNVPTIIETGLVSQVYTNGRKEHTVHRDSEMYQTLNELNEAIYEAYTADAQSA